MMIRARLRRLEKQLTSSLSEDDIERVAEVYNAVLAWFDWAEAGKTGAEPAMPSVADQHHANRMLNAALKAEGMDLIDTHCTGACLD